ncbi:hypothetical protein [Nitrosomonas supralitoralis]|uniref:Uncharacterized protein n=1 Tax=Nitrosomonas supralitoralis TaxID=2116706 RepID=A0A2P7NQY6_9PROT|nr:hypothetical protein [Nitrosomonas supralitoralis]PSJ15896.1 hypothetical protein C7H79_16485 [Nitrosomonas supralitoralis]
MVIRTERNQRIRSALERYQEEYYPEAGILFRNGQQKQSELSGNFANKLRTKGDEVKRRNEYAQELHNINHAYFDERFTLHKNHTGRYWKEVYATRYNTRDVQQALSAIKAHDIYELNAHNWHRTARWA